MAGSSTRGSATSEQRAPIRRRVGRGLPAARLRGFSHQRMLRAIVIAFIAGWTVWFWIDKSPHSLGPLPPPLEEEYSANFQIAVDLVKAQRYKAAFVYLWKAHYLLLSAATGLLIAMIGGPISRLLGRRRFARLYIPARKRSSGAAPGQPTEQEKRQVESD